MDPDLGPNCLPVCKNRFEKFARIFSRRHEQTTFSDAGFLGALRVNIFADLNNVTVTDYLLRMSPYGLWRAYWVCQTNATGSKAKGSMPLVNWDSAMLKVTWENKLF